MDAKSERMQILEMIESGRISASQGLALLQVLAESEAEPEEAPPTELPLPDGSQAGGWLAPQLASTNTAAIPLPPPVQQPFAGNDHPFRDEGAAAASAPAWEPLAAPIEQPAAPFETPVAAYDQSPSRLPDDAAKWRRWWTIPLWIGVFITVWGGLFMYWSVRSADGVSLWFLCASVPFALGILVIALAFQSRTAPWLHLRVQQKPGAKPQRIALSFPLPVGPAAWLLHTFGGRIPQVQEHSLDEVIRAVGQNATAENPIYIQVDEDSGEKVEIYIG